MKTKKETQDVQRYGRDAFLASDDWVQHKDILSALMADGEEYSEDEAKSLVESYLKKEVR